MRLPQFQSLALQDITLINPLTANVRVITDIGSFEGGSPADFSVAQLRLTLQDTVFAAIFKQVNDIQIEAVKKNAPSRADDFIVARNNTPEKIDADDFENLTRWMGDVFLPNLPGIKSVSFVVDTEAPSLEAMATNPRVIGGLVKPPGSSYYRYPTAETTDWDFTKFPSINVLKSDLVYFLKHGLKGNPGSCQVASLLLKIIDEYLYNPNDELTKNRGYIDGRFAISEEYNVQYGYHCRKILCDVFGSKVRHGVLAVISQCLVNEINDRWQSRADRPAMSVSGCSNVYLPPSMIDQCATTPFEEIVLAYQDRHLTPSVSSNGITDHLQETKRLHEARLSSINAAMERCFSNARHGNQAELTVQLSVQQASHIAGQVEISASTTQVQEQTCEPSPPLGDGFKRIYQQIKRRFLDDREHDEYVIYLSPLPKNEPLSWVTNLKTRPLQGITHAIGFVYPNDITFTQNQNVKVHFYRCEPKNATASNPSTNAVLFLGEANLCTLIEHRSGASFNSYRDPNPLLQHYRNQEKDSPYRLQDAERELWSNPHHGISLPRDFVVSISSKQSNAEAYAYTASQLLKLTQNGELDGDFIAIPTLNHDGALEKNNVQLGRGEGNLHGRFYFLPWSSPKPHEIRTSDGVRIQSFQITPATGDPRPYEPGADIPQWDLTRTEIKLATDGQPYTSLRINSKEQRLIEAHVHNTLNSLLANNPGLKATLANWDLRPFIAARVHLGPNGLAQLRDFLDYVRQVGNMGGYLLNHYFSKFTQLNYFIEPTHFNETSAAIERINQLGIHEQELFTRLIGNIGLSRQPLSRIVNDYGVFLNDIHSISVSAEQLCKAQWRIPYGGSCPTVMMGALWYILKTAADKEAQESKPYLRTQLACLDGLELSGVQCLPLYRKETAILCAQALSSPIENPQNYLTDSVAVSKNKPFASFRRIPSWSALTEHVTTRQDFYRYLTSAPIGLDSFKTLSVRIRFLFVDEKRKPVELEKGLLLCLIVFLHRTNASVNSTQCDAIHTKLRESRDILQAMMNELLQNPDIQFSNAQSVLAYLSLMKKESLDQANLAASGLNEPNRATFISIWRRSPLAIEQFYANCSTCRPKELSERFQALKTLIDHPCTNISPFMLSNLVSLLIDSTNLDTVIESIIRLNHVDSELRILKLKEIILTLIKPSRRYRSTELIQYIKNGTPFEVIDGATTASAPSATPQIQRPLSSDSEILSILNEYRAFTTTGPEEPLTTQFLHNLLSNYKEIILEDHFYKIKAFYYNTLFNSLTESAQKLMTEACMSPSRIYSRADFKDMLEAPLEDTQLLNLRSFLQAGDELPELMMMLTRYRHHRHIRSLLDQMTTPRVRTDCIRLSKAEYPVNVIEAFLNRIRASTTGAAYSKDLIQVLCDEAPLPLISHYMSHLPLMGLDNYELIIQLTKHIDPLLFLNLMAIATGPAERIDLLNSLIQGFSGPWQDQTRLPTIMAWVIKSLVSSKETIDGTRLMATVGQLVSLEDSEFARWTSLYDKATPSLSRLMDGKIDELETNPRGSSPFVMTSTSNSFAEKIAKATVRTTSTQATQLAADYADHLSLAKQPVYQGKTLAMVSIKEIPQWLHTLREARDISPEDKARLALPLIEKAMHFATTSNYVMNETQRLSIIQAMCSNQPVIMHKIETGEGKTLTGVIHAALLWVAKGGCVEYSAPSWTDAFRDLSEFGGFFNTLGIPVSKQVIMAQSSENDYLCDGINFSSLELLGLFHQKNPDHLPKDTPISAVIGEIDSALFDRNDPQRIARPVALLNDQDWIYRAVYAVTLEVYQGKSIDEFKSQLRRDLTSNGVITHLTRWLDDNGQQWSEKQRNAALRLIQSLEPTHWVTLFCASFQCILHPLVEDNDYKLIINPETGRHHVHPIAHFRAADSHQTQFSLGVHQALCAQINSTRNDIQVVTPPLMLSESETNIKGYILHLIRRGAHILASSGTPLGNDQENRWLAQYLGKDMAVVEWPRERMHNINEPTKKECQGVEDQYRSLIHKIREIQQGNPLQPILIAAKNVTTAQTIAKHIQAQIVGANVQFYDADTQNEWQFLKNAAVPGTISVATPALGRNTNIEQHQHGLALIITDYFSERDDKQLRGRVGRYGATGEIHYIRNQTDLVAFRQSEARPLHCDIGLHFLTEFNLFAADNNTHSHREKFKAAFIKKEGLSFIDYVKDQAIQLDRGQFLVWLSTLTFQYDHVDEQFIEACQAMRDRFVLAEETALKNANPSLSEPIPYTPNPRERRYETLERLCSNPQIRAILQPSQAQQVDLLTQWLQAENISQAEDGFIVAQLLTKRSDTECLQAMREALMGEHGLDVASAELPGKIHCFNEKGLFSSKLMGPTTYEVVRQRLLKLVDDNQFEVFVAASLAAPENIFDDDFLKKLKGIVLKPENWKILLKFRTIPALSAYFESHLLAPDKAIIKTNVQKWISQKLDQKETFSKEDLADLRTLQTQVLGAESLLAQDCIKHQFDHYRKSAWYIEPRRKTAMNQIEQLLVSTKPFEARYASIASLVQQVIEGDVIENQNRFFKSLHYSGESRFVTLMKTLLPLLKATEPGINPIPEADDLRRICNPASRQPKGFNQVIVSYNEMVSELSPESNAPTP